MRDEPSEVTMRLGGGPAEADAMPTAPSTDEYRADHFPAVLVRRGEDLADLDRRLQACLLIVRQVTPALTSPA